MHTHYSIVKLKAGARLKLKYFVCGSFWYELVLPQYDVCRGRRLDGGRRLDDHNRLTQDVHARERCISSSICYVFPYRMQSTTLCILQENFRLQKKELNMWPECKGLQAIWASRMTVLQPPFACWLQPHACRRQEGRCKLPLMLLQMHAHTVKILASMFETPERSVCAETQRHA
jgi:hypothetical protein